MAPFASNIAQRFLDDIKNGTIGADALILVSDDMVVSEDLFTKPLIISQVTYTDANTLEPYAFNTNLNRTLRATMNHTFINNCYVLNTVTPTYLILCGLWALVGLLWYALTYWFKRNQAIFL